MSCTEEVVDPNLNPDRSQVVLEPCNYIASMPSKGVRGSAIDALDIWYEVPDESRQIIREIITTLHNSSLM